MSKDPKLDAPKMPTGTYPELSPNPNSKGVELKDGGRGTPVIVNTEPRSANTNTITVNEVKRLIREAIDHFEKEEGGVTEKELQEALKVKADKVGFLPYFEVTSSTVILTFIDNNNLLAKPFIAAFTDRTEFYVCLFKTGSPNKYNFEMEELCSVKRYTGANASLSTFANIFNYSNYQNDYLTDNNAKSYYARIHKAFEGVTLTDAIWSGFKTGDILKVNNMQFIINVFETTGESAYKGVTGTMVGAVTANSITIVTLDWRTVGEGYTELEPTLTTLTIS